MVGTAQMRLCPPYSFTFQTALCRRSFAISPRFHASFSLGTSCPLKIQRAQGMPGARCTRSLACEKVKSTRASHHRFTETVRHSLRDGFNAYFVLSPVTGLFCHRRLRNSFRKLDASVGASGPHDFAVRVGAVRRQPLRVHRIPRPTSVTIAIRPS
jgi:hypothetical protein